MYVSFTLDECQLNDAGGFIQAETDNFTVGMGLSDDPEVMNMAQHQKSAIPSFCNGVPVKDCYMAKLLSHLASCLNMHQAKTERKDKKERKDQLPSSSGLMNQCCRKEESKTNCFAFSFFRSPEDELPNQKAYFAYPWLPDFKFQCKISVDQKQLKHLIAVYVKKIAPKVKKYYLQPTNATKVKHYMQIALMWFNISYGDILNPMNHSSYLNSMSELVSMYIDMELSAALNVEKESIGKVTSQLTSLLYVLLHRSEMHILDAILGAKLIHGKCRSICNVLVEKVVKQLRYSPQHNEEYVRHLLAHKLWKRVSGMNKKNKVINRLAVLKLTPPPSFSENACIVKCVLPKLPKFKRNITRFYMLAKFNLKIACEMFLKTVRSNQETVVHDRNPSLDFSERVFDSATWLDSDNTDVEDICCYLGDNTTQILVKDELILNQCTEKIIVKSETDMLDANQNTEVNSEVDDSDSNVSLDQAEFLDSDSCNMILSAMARSSRISNCEQHSSPLATAIETNQVAITEITHRPEPVAVELWSNWDPVFSSSAELEPCALDSSVTGMTLMETPIRDVFNTSSVEIDSEEDILAVLRSRASLCYGEVGECEYEALPLQDLLSNTLCSEEDLHNSSEQHLHQSSLHDTVSDHGNSNDRCSNMITFNGDSCSENLHTEALNPKQDTLPCTHAVEGISQSNEVSRENIHKQFMKFVAHCKDQSLSPGSQSVSSKQGSSISDSPLPFKKRHKVQT